MDNKTVEQLSKLLKGEGSVTEQLIAEIYSEVNQIHQKQDEKLKRLKGWEQKR